MPWAVALAGALVACGKSTTAGPTTPGNPSNPAPPDNSGVVTLRAITVDPPTATTNKGLSVNFSATGTYSDGSKALLPIVTWSSSDDLVAQVDPEAGVADCKKTGPVTITATDHDSGIQGTAQLMVADAKLQSVELSPSVASIVVGFARTFTLVGRYSDGTTSTISAVAWSSSDNGTNVTVSAGTVTGMAAGGPVTLTAKDTQSGLSGTASLTIVAPPTPQDVAASSTGQLGSGGVFFGHATGLAPGTEYLVRVTGSDPSVAIEADKDASFSSPICATWATGPACHAGALAGSDLFFTVSGPADASYAVDVFPIPGLPAGAATVTTEDYYKITGLDPAASSTFTVTLGALTDVAADAFVYSSAQPAGAFDSNMLCSTASALPDATKTCSGPVPLDGTIYITVEGWLTGTGGPIPVAPGSSYTLSL